MRVSLRSSHGRVARNVHWRRSLALAALCSTFFTGGCGGAEADADAPVHIVSESERMPAPVPASAACEDGETRECKITLNVRAGTVTCTTGIEACSNGAWGECYRTTDPEEESAE